MAARVGAPMSGDGTPGGISLWADLDGGTGIWENVPTAVRAAFRSLLASVEAVSKQQVQSIETSESNDQQHIARIQQLEGAVEKIVDNGNYMGSAIKTLQR